jgi:tetratricopeptide (TPR) repeat protein
MGAAWLGLRAGQTQRDAEALATQTVELKKQYDLGVADLAAGRFELAIERFEFILTADPNYPGAADKLAEARRALNITSTAPPPATPTLPPVSGDPATLLALAQQAHAAGHWDEVITYLANLQALDPDYNPVVVDQLLFDALRNRGVARIQGDEMELGITDLDQAEAFAPLDEEAANHRRWAKSYLAAQSYWGVNWEQTVLILEELYLIAPYFKDTAARLYQATLNYAAQLDANGDYCGAAQYYANAQALVADPANVEAQATAQANCALATPTPDPNATPLPVTETPTPY